MSAAFPIHDGDTVTYITSHGFYSGYFVRWNKNGAAIIRKPSGGNVTLQPNLLRPCNDGRMIKKRGHIPWPTPEPKEKK